MARILVIEDEITIQELVKFNLEKDGFQVLIAGDGRKGLEMVKHERPDLVILDLMLPVLDGYEVCKALRANEKTAGIPIVILSARNEVADKVIGLELGADDYLTKPFSPRELTARIKARLREGQHPQIQSKQKELRWGDLEIIPDSYIISLAGKPLSLTVKEFELLTLFMSNPTHVFSREYLLQQVWGYSTNADTRTVDVHISNLRNKLKPMSHVLESVRGVGYRFALKMH